VEDSACVAHPCATALRTPRWEKVVSERAK
jgi:hypothetical protein